MNLVWNWNGRVAAMLVAMVAALAPTPASAEVVTLKELEELALQNQARWEAVEATATQASAEVRAARAGLKPSFWMNVLSVVAPGSDIERVATVDDRVVNVRASPTVNERTAFRPNIRYEGTIDMRIPLYDGQNRASIRAAEAYQAAAQASSSASRETVLAMVRTAYLDWLATHLDHDFATTSAAEAKAQRERTEARVDDGDRPRSELDVARYQELEAELFASDAAARLGAAKRRLESAVGIDLSPDAEPDTGLLAIDSASDTGEREWELEALELQRKAAQQEADMHRKSRVPVLAVIGQTGLAGINDDVFPMYRVGVNLAVPLWDGGRAVSLAQAADARAGELDALTRDAQLERNDARKQALADREHAEEQLVLAERLVAVSEKRVDQAQTAYELGAGDLEALADSRAALREAQSRRVQIRVGRADAVLRLTDSPPQ